MTEGVFGWPQKRAWCTESAHRIRRDSTHLLVRKYAQTLAKACQACERAIPAYIVKAAIGPQAGGKAHTVA